MMLKRYALHLLFLINAALGLTLVWLWVTPDGTLRNIHWKVPAPHTTDFVGMLPALPGVASADTSQFIAMLDRPLFSPSRRPPPPPPPPQAQAPVDNLSTAILSGLFFGDGVGGIILNISGKSRRVRLNDAVDGWTVKSIQGRSVTFARGGESRILQLPRAALATYTGIAGPAGQASQAPPASQSMSPRLSPGVSPPGGASPDGAPPRSRAVFGGTR